MGEYRQYEENRDDDTTEDSEGGSEDTAEFSEEMKENHRLGTIGRWDAPDSDWAAVYDWTRYRGPPPWPASGGWVFKDPEEGGWWEYFGDAGIGHGTYSSLLDEFKDDDSVDDVGDAIEEVRGPYAFLEAETANPDEVSFRNYEDEELEWTLRIDDTEVFRRVEPDRSDMMGAVAEGLYAYHVGSLDEMIDNIGPSSGRKPDDIREQEELERRREENESLGSFADE